MAPADPNVPPEDERAGGFGGHGTEETGQRLGAAEDGAVGVLAPEVRWPGLGS